MLKPYELQTNRAVLMDALYEASGRTCCTYTGLWQEFCDNLGANMRDIDGLDVKAACVKAINDTNSVMVDKHASACMEVFRAHMMRGWEDA